MQTGLAGSSLATRVLTPTKHRAKRVITFAAYKAVKMEDSLRLLESSDKKESMFIQIQNTNYKPKVANNNEKNCNNNHSLFVIIKNKNEIIIVISRMIDLLITTI